MTAYKNPQGESAENAVKAFLEGSGCKVTPYGIEHTLKDVAKLDWNDYANLQLEKVITSAPDFFVLSPNDANYWLLEVKYRRGWGPNTVSELKEHLEPQTQCWPRINVLIAIKSPIGEVGKPECHLRAGQLFCEAGQLSVHVRSREVTKKWDAVEWQDLFPLHEFFSAFCRDAAGRSRLGQLVETIRNIPDESVNTKSMKKLWNENQAKKLAKTSAAPARKANSFRDSTS